MPFGDGTGPRGMGPMTGRGMGRCAGFPVPGFMNPGPGRGGYGGYGRGFQRRYRAYWPHGYPEAVDYPPGYTPYAAPFGGVGAPFAPGAMPTKKQELDFLANEAQAMKSQLEEIESRIKELEK